MNEQTNSWVLSFDGGFLNEVRHSFNTEQQAIDKAKQITIGTNDGTKSLWDTGGFFINDQWYDSRS